MTDERVISVLVVEDNPLDVALIRRHLGKSDTNYRVSVVGELCDALEDLKNGFEVVLLDLNLTDSCGLDTLHAIRRQAGSIPVVILTGHEDERLALEAVRHGAQDYLSKNQVSTDLLTRTILHAIERLRLHRAEAELNLAGSVQRSLLPTSFPQIKGIDIAGRCDPVAWAGGDYFDFATVEDDLWLVIADVCGHGMDAAMFMAEMRGVIQTLFRTDRDGNPGTMLAHTNKILRSCLENNKFVAVFIGRLNVHTHLLRYASAGHPGYCVSTNGVPVPLQSHDPPVGVCRTQDFATHEVLLQPGEFFVSYTDGIYESYNAANEQFGHTRTIEVLHEYRQASSQAMVSQLFGAACAFSENDAPPDDMCAIVVKVEAAGEGAD